MWWHPRPHCGVSGLKWHCVFPLLFFRPAFPGLFGMLLQKPSNWSRPQLQTTQKYCTASTVQLFHGEFCQWSAGIKILSPWETPLKLSLYVIYTENKACAKNHRERLFKHNSHAPWKMIKDRSLIVNIHIFRICSFKMELLLLMSSSQLSKTVLDKWLQSTKQLSGERRKAIYGRRKLQVFK